MRGRIVFSLLTVMMLSVYTLAQQPAFADGRAKIRPPDGTLKNSSHVTEVVASADWFMQTAPMVVAVGLLLFAAVMLVRAQYVMAIMIFLGGLLAAGALKIVSSVGG